MTKVEISGTGKGLSPDGDAGWCLRVCLDLLDGVTARHGMEKTVHSLCLPCLLCRSGGHTGQQVGFMPAGRL